MLVNNYSTYIIQYYILCYASLTAFHLFILGSLMHTTSRQSRQEHDQDHHDVVLLTAFVIITSVIVTAVSIGFLCKFYLYILFIFFTCDILSAFTFISGSKFCTRLISYFIISLVYSYLTRDMSFIPDYRTLENV